MHSITASCICSADLSTGANLDNLLFAGQLLPEHNGGLSGTPSTGAEPPFAAGVFRGYGPDGAAETAAHRAASALRDAQTLLAEGTALSNLLFPFCAEMMTETGAPSGCSMAAVFLSRDRLSLASCGVCRAYLFRDRSLFLLTPTAGAGAQPYTVSGRPVIGDRLLLCTGTLAETLSAQQILELCPQTRSDTDALQQLLLQARNRNAQGSITAVLLRIE